MKTVEVADRPTQVWSGEGLSKKEELARFVDDIFAGDRLLFSREIDESFKVNPGATLASDHLNRIYFERSRELRLSSPGEQLMAVILLTSKDVDYGEINQQQRVSATAQLLRSAQHGIFRNTGGDETTFRDKSEADTARIIQKSFKYVEDWMDEPTKAIVQDAVAEADLQLTPLRRFLVFKDRVSGLINKS